METLPPSKEDSLRKKSRKGKGGKVNLPVIISQTVNGHITRPRFLISPKTANSEMKIVG